MKEPNELTGGIDPENLEGRKEEKQDYTVRRKRIYKGVMSPLGQIYLVVNVKLAKGKLEAAKLIKGGLGEQAEKSVAEYMVLKLKERYKF
jgi:hypothetical protein